MKYLLAEKIIFKGPDPPPADWKINDADLAPPEPVTQKAAAKGKVVDTPPVEVLKSP